MTENEIAKLVIFRAMEVHTALGPGLMESAYKECLFYKLNQSGLFVEKEKPIPIEFEGVKLDCGYRLDILVEGKLVIELKTVAELSDIHLAQILSYLKLGKFKLGLILNFKVLRLKDGIRRVVNGL